MGLVRCLGICFVVMGIACGGADGNGDTRKENSDTDEMLGGEPEALAGITAAHNAVRERLSLPDLLWDDALAAIALEWAEQCVDDVSPSGLVDHNSGRSDDYEGYVGENIYGSTGRVGPQDAVHSWASEQQYYDYDTNTCASGQQCGHYTQVVWRNTARVGCALVTCSDLRFSGTVVCNYSPGGNIGDLRPY